MRYKKKNIPLRTKSSVAIRDNGICQNCGKIGLLKPTYFGYMAFEKVPTWYCKDKGAISGIYKGLMSFEVDHTIPEFLGGDLTLENLRLLCRVCNRRKGKKYDKPMV